MSVYQWAVIEAILDPVLVAEQKGKRPVLVVSVVSNEEFNQAMPNVTILPLTSTKRRLYPSEVLIRKDKAGQPFDSIIMAHQIRTLSKQRLGTLIGYLEDLIFQIDIQAAVKEHLDLD